MSDLSDKITARFVRYAAIDTQSDPYSNTFPSTEKQKNLSRLLVDELQQMGYTGAYMDEHGYVFAWIKPTTAKSGVPAVCFCSHVDTAPDCSGTNVKPIVHRNYNGSDIVLPDDTTQVITTAGHPYLAEKTGDDIITASGTTLLGADDKAGVAIIMQFAAYLAANPEVKHGGVQILFTPDEEVGRGVNKLDMKKVNAVYGYTLDGGPEGSIEGDTFSANAFKVIFSGISAHPGYAKGKMVNAMKVLSYFMSKLPADRLCPEATEETQGFVHPTRIEGELETASATFIIRDFETSRLANHQQELINLAEEAIAVYPGSSFKTEVTEQYRNMREILKQHPVVEATAVEAMKRAGIKPSAKLVRGGTDGSRLSFMGLPCPNLFTGEMAIHSKHEYVSAQDMEKAMLTMVEIVKLYEENT